MATDGGPRSRGATARTARMLARADVRRAWRGAIGLGLIAALAGGVVVALALGARRTQTAYARLVEAGHYAGVRVDLFGTDQARAAAVRARPEVDDSTVASGYVGRRDATEDWVQVSAVADRRALDRMLVVRGRAPAPGASDEVVLTEHTAAVMGLAPGDRFGARFYAAAQFGDVQRDV